MKNMLLAFGLLASSSFAQATIYDISVNNGSQDILMGYVDTRQDALFVTAVIPWSPGLYHHMRPAVPDFSDEVFTNNEWKWDALTADGSVYDIADNWDGILGGTWGFASNIDVESIPYLDDVAPSDPFFKFYTSLGMSKMYFPLAGIFNYAPHQESTRLADGSYFSGLSHILNRAALTASPESLDDFATSAHVFDAGINYVLSKREEVPEPGSLVLLLVGFFSLCASRLGLGNKR
jgi:hypothetical protein